MYTIVFLLFLQYVQLTEQPGGTTAEEEDARSALQALQYSGKAVLYNTRIHMTIQAQIPTFHVFLILMQKLKIMFINDK